MKINSHHYLQLVERIASTAQARNKTQGVESDPGREQKEISALLSLIRCELAKLETKPAPERLAKLQELADKIKAGAYRVNPSATASAMLGMETFDHDKGTEL